LFLVSGLQQDLGDGLYENKRVGSAGERTYDHANADYWSKAVPVGDRVVACFLPEWGLSGAEVRKQLIDAVESPDL
jgi:hypothetical protein